MSWIDAFKRDAVAVALPDWELRDDDQLDLLASFEPAWSDVTPGDGFTIDVVAQRADGSDRRAVSLSNVAAVEFFHDLMKRGSERTGA